MHTIYSPEMTDFKAFLGCYFYWTSFLIGYDQQNYSDEVVNEYNK